MKTTLLKLALLVFLINISFIESSAQKVSLKDQIKEKVKDKDKDKDKGKGKDKGKDKDKDKNRKSIPIDGGIGLLLAAGVGLGARKFIKHRRENKL